MERERRERRSSNRLFSKHPFIKILLFFCLGVVTSLFLTWWNINVPRKIVSTIKKTEDFKTRRVSLGKQECEVSIQQNTRIMLGAGKNQPYAHENIAPIIGCENLMVIDFKYPANESVLEAIRKVPGIISMRNGSHRIVVHRPCLANDSLDSLWKWEVIWQGIESALTKHYTE